MTDNRFKAWAARGFDGHLLPIIPPDATLSARSKIKPEARGKTPGRRNSYGEWGSFDWRGWHQADEDLAEWHAMGAGVGLRLGTFVAADVDVLDPELAEAVAATVQDNFGDTVTRIGRPPKRVLLYRAVGPLRRRRLWIKQEGYAEPALFELLGDGQQVVVDGIHPQTRRPYAWDDEPLADTLHLLDEYMVDALFEELRGLCDMLGYECWEEGSGSAARDRMTVRQAELAAPDIEAVRKAVEAIENNNADFPGRTDYIRFACAIRAACAADPDAGEDIFLEWALRWEGNERFENNDIDEARSDYHRCKPPFEVGWPLIAQLAGEYGCRIGAEYAFEGEDLPTRDEDDDGEDGDEDLGWIGDMAYVAELNRYLVLRTGALWAEESFRRMYAHIGDPSSAKENAAAIFQRHPRARKVDALTYQPHQGRIVEEDGQTLFNCWKRSGVVPAAGVTVADVQPWLDHLAFVVPDAEQRETLLDWCAHVLRFGKPNWGVILGGAPGVGKDLLMLPFARAIGSRNYRAINESDLDGQWTWWAAETQLVVIAEMRALTPATYNKVKAYVARPPEKVVVNKKGVPQYEVPNTAAYFGFTNYPNAVPLDEDDRRWFVMWSGAEPQDAAYYTQLAAWLDKPGTTEAVAGYLLQRDLSAFNATGRAPDTDAKQEMIHASRPAFDQWVIEAVQEGTLPFDADLVAVEDLLSRLPHYARQYRPTRKALVKALREAGARPLLRVSLGKPLPTTGTKRTHVWALRRTAIYGGLDKDALVARFWSQYEASKGTGCDMPADDEEPAAV